MEVKWLSQRRGVNSKSPLEWGLINKEQGYVISSLARGFILLFPFNLGLSLAVFRGQLFSKPLQLITQLFKFSFGWVLTQL